MCGIFASVIRGSPGLEPSDKLGHRLRNRGPDRTGTVHRRLGPGDGNPDWTSLTFASSVLALRGDGITGQPLMNPQTGAVLCWNGEAWSIDGKPVTGNDATAIFPLLQSAEGVDAVLDVLRSIQGPFAFIYWDGRRDGQIFFGRDRLGRRSLLAQDARDYFLLSSVADSTASSWNEVEADGVYVMDLVDLVDPAPEAVGSSSVSRYDWTPEAEEEHVRLNKPISRVRPPKRKDLVVLLIVFHSWRRQGSHRG
jgi:asparagine synthetase B (glutamine-hydrolysing)